MVWIACHYQPLSYVDRFFARGVPVLDCCLERRFMESFREQAGMCVHVPLVDVFNNVGVLRVHVFHGPQRSRSGWFGQWLRVSSLSYQGYRETLYFVVQLRSFPSCSPLFLLWKGKIV